jgi:hypothetical protein
MRRSWRQGRAEGRRRVRVRWVCAVPVRGLGLGLACGLAVLGVLGPLTASAVAAPSAAVTLYVSSAGSASSGCTEALPCTTILDAITAGESDIDTAVTIDVAAGTYTEDTGDQIDVPVSDTLDIEGAGASSTIIQGQAEVPLLVFNVAGGTVTIDGVSITGNSNATQLPGGAISVDSDAALTADHDTFSDDSAPSGGGGGIFSADGVVIADDDTFSGDSAGDGGGGIENDGGSLSADNDTFSGDSGANGGGGVENDNGSAVLVDDTFSGDSATGGVAGGFESNDGNASLEDSILDAAPCGVVNGGTVSDGGGNVVDVGGNGCGLSSPGDVLGVSDTAIGLGSLAANGSSGPETLAIGPGSAAFEEASCPLGTDERGDPRPGVSGAAMCDAGAVEYQAPPSVLLSVSVAGAGSGSVSSSPVGIDCGGGETACSASFMMGSMVMLTASPVAGDGFEGFSGGGCPATLSASCTVSLSSAESVAATFGLAPSVSITSPTPNQSLVFGEPSPPSYAFSCMPGGSATLASSGGCVGKVGSTVVTSGEPVSTAIPGPYTLSVTATDTDGVSTTVTRGYTVSRAATVLSATPVLPGGVSATLTRADTGVPLAGQVLVFTAGKKTLCTAVTNAKGQAGCPSVTAALDAVENLGYTVAYAGSNDYLPASASAPAVARGSR